MALAKTAFVSKCVKYCSYKVSNEYYMLWCKSITTVNADQVMFLTYSKGSLERDEANIEEWHRKRGKAELTVWYTNIRWGGWAPCLCCCVCRAGKTSRSPSCFTVMHSHSLLPTPLPLPHSFLDTPTFPFFFPLPY